MITEQYYSEIVGGVTNRVSFLPYNISDNITDVVIAYCDDIAISETFELLGIEW